MDKGDDLLTGILIGAGAVLLGALVLGDSKINLNVKGGNENEKDSQNEKSGSEGQGNDQTKCK